MAKNVGEILNALPVERREKISARAKALRAEYLMRQDLFQARGQRKEELAKKVEEMGQNLSVSQLRAYIKAMGGELQLVAKFSDGESLVLTGLSEVEDSDEE
ncbi:MAG: hypothetical protein SAJ37_09835 [Oscillatoria sp. PMC 1068.18]|nr:hypothetical protein [Oscillatoria sp. PMC 1068.18]